MRLGAIISDIAGSRFEWDNIKTKDFDLLTHKCQPTDDSIMSLAICDAIMSSKKDFSNLAEPAVSCMQEYGYKSPDVGYGGNFNR